MPDSISETADDVQVSLADRTQTGHNTHCTATAATDRQGGGEQFGREGEGRVDGEREVHCVFYPGLDILIGAMVTFSTLTNSTRQAALSIKHLPIQNNTDTR